MNEIKISAIRPFDDPPEGAKYVVFVSDFPYLDEEQAFEHLKKVVQYSKYFGIYTIPFRFLKDDKITLCMISPKGEICGIQQAVHLSLSYRNILQKSDEINIINTPDGAFFLCVDVDLFHPEVMRKALDLGAEIAVCSRYMDIINDTPFRACFGSENAGMSNKMYILDVTEEGGRFINPWSGNKCFRETKEMGKVNRVLTCDLDILREDREKNTLELNKKLYSKYIDYLVR